MRARGDRFEVEFDRLVTVKGEPELARGGQRRARYAGGSGSNRLAFQAPAGEQPGSPAQLVQERGAVIGSEAVADLLFADPRLPALSA